MPSCQNTTPTPSPILALICLAIVRRMRPEWVAIALGEAASTCEISPQRLSRLSSRALPIFEAAVRTLTCIGRPAVDRGARRGEDEAGLLRALLSVATSILEQIPLRSDVVRHQILGAWGRLRGEHPGLTLERFTSALGLSARTFRDWRKKASARTAPRSSPEQAPPATRPRRRRRPARRPRFGFDVTLPDTQLAADTTDIEVFGVGLKLVAAQDVGGRDQDLFDSVIVDERESADRVVEVLTQAIGESVGQQVVTDQGTPYMAKATEAALEELECEHAPQREGDPIGKATVERAFLTAKEIAGPIFSLTNTLARTVPALGRGDLAVAAGKLIIATLLRAYQAGARATRRAIEERSGLDEEALSRAADASRERARAHDRSARLLLAHIHEVFGFEGSAARFVNAFRRYSVPVLKAAERAFATRAHRDDIRDRQSYFGAIARKCSERHQRELARDRALNEQARRASREAAHAEAEAQRRRDHPATSIREALALIAMAWRPEHRDLLFGGAGLGTGRLIEAHQRLVELHPLHVVRDITRGAFHSFAIDFEEVIGADGVAAVLAVAEERLDGMPTPTDELDFTPTLATAMLRATGPPPRPAPSTALRT